MYQTDNFVVRLGRRCILALSLFGRGFIFLIKLLRVFSFRGLKFSLVMEQFYRIGFRTLLVILASSAFVGMVLGYQSYASLVIFSAESQVGLVVALSLTRELAPIVCALLFIGRASSSITAEIGMMKSTQQIDAMQMMGVDVEKRIAEPRFLATIVCLPLLTVIFNAMGILGAFVIVSSLGLDAAPFWNGIYEGVKVGKDLFSGLLKSLVFAFVAGWISIWFGFESKGSSQDLGMRTTNTVVVSSLLVLALDFVLTSLLFQIGEL